MKAEEFIQQLLALQKAMPRPSTFNDNCTNSEYTNYVGNCKNCYLSFGDADEEDCYYTRWSFRNIDCADIDDVEDSELCYECLDSSHCYNCNFCQDCDNLVDCHFCYNCIGCRNCYGCINLRRKEYCYGNEQLTKEEYEKKVQSLHISHDQQRKHFLEFQIGFPRVYMHQRQTEQCTGDYIFRSKNCLSCFDTWDCQDSLYLLCTYDLKDCMDTNFIAGKGSELNYELLSGWFTSSTNFSYACWHSHNLEYCELCFHSHDLFGCIGLTHKEYCVLNKAYSKDEYNRLVEEIKKDMREKNLYGRFFLPSAYPYEDSMGYHLSS